ncbi:MAG TPA: response regulator [Magnetospirillum sp.]|nr:response regulator [Magnetospirillum sp.]
MRPKALVVEDSRFYLQILRTALEERLGFEVVSASTLADTRDILAARSSDILVALLDLHLPDAPNGEVVREVAQHRIPSIVFTASFSDEARAFVLAHNAVDYVTKDSPGNLETVFDLVRRIGRNTSNRILVVDDSRSSRQHIGDLLRLHRFDVIEANDGAAALTALDGNPDIRMVIVDYNMPGMSGADLTRKIRGRFARNELVVIGLSAAGNNLVSARFMKAGANDYLNKPFVPEEFFCRIYHNLDLVEQIGTLRQAQSELKTALAAVGRASDEKTRFLGHLNHEMGTPLNAIIGFSDLSLNGNEALPPQAGRYMASIHQCALHLKELVSDALDMARIEAGHLELDLAEVDLGGLCLEIIALLSLQIEASGVHIEGDFVPGRPMISGDRRRLKQVLLNLLSNAIKFTPTGGRILVGAGTDAEGRPYLAVEDSGCGMDEAGIAVALAPFGQLGGIESRSKGTGLGLPLAKSLIEGHGGDLSISSTPGVGTTMMARLPADRLLNT